MNFIELAQEMVKEKNTTFRSFERPKVRIIAKEMLRLHAASRIVEPAYYGKGCSNCGHEAIADQPFCPGCGHGLEWKS